MEEWTCRRYLILRPTISFVGDSKWKHRGQVNIFPIFVYSLRCISRQSLLIASSKLCWIIHNVAQSSPFELFTISLSTSFKLLIQILIQSQKGKRKKQTKNCARLSKLQFSTESSFERRVLNFIARIPFEHLFLPPASLIIAQLNRFTRRGGLISSNL